MSGALRNTVDRLGHMAGALACADQSDCQLLEQFAATGDEEAFAVLVQ